MATEFSAKYTNANIAQDASRYESQLFLKLYNNLAKLLPSAELGASVITVQLVAQRRGDAVAPLFSDVTKDKSESEVRKTFIAVREAVTLATPFVGLPNTMPACFGLVNALRERGIEEVVAPRRESFQDFNYTPKGQETTSAIYRGVGNSEVRTMIQQYFPEMSYWGRTSIWGFLVGSSPIFELRDTEILIAGSIMALGATRQARSHVKCSLQIGNSKEVVSAVLESAKEIAVWNGRPLAGPIDIDELAEELERNLAANV